MSDDDAEGMHAHGFGIEIPVGMIRAIRESHDTSRGHAEDRHNAAMRWFDGLDTEGLLALRWILACDDEGAYGNNKFYDGMAAQRLRALGVDPTTGLDPAAQLLEREALKASEKD